ncbi:uncharacterized protein [Linepithema humile]|uniref:uncharacterized protein n=1 Tax=Linepithema humile TaxID=83485 RepID=UPI00351E04EC
MFQSSKTTVDEVVQMIHTYCVRFNCSDEARLALFNMATIWAGSNFSTFMNSKYMISKRLDPPEELNQYVFYCTECNSVLGKFYRKDLLSRSYRHCNGCQQKYKISTNSSKYFVSTDIKFQLQTVLRNSNVCKLLLRNIKNIESKLTNKNLNTIVDVYDGEIYKTLYNSKRKNTILLTFNFNVDGAPISKSSKSSMWPIQLIINELPKNIRFRYILLAGICITKSEPNSQFMNLYMNVFIEQIRDLMKNGIVISLENGKKCNFILQPLCSSVDSVARPIIQNRFQFNGYFGCSWCYHYGEYVNGAMRYPFMDDDPPLRDHESYIKDMKYAEKIHRPSKGVKNFAEITNLENFDCVWGFLYDYMHGLLLVCVCVCVCGVVCTLWTKFWANIGTKEYNLSKIDKINIEKRLLNIKMPSKIHRSPRSFNSGKWKASEWRSWVLYLSIPCLLRILNTKYLSSFGLLVRCTHKLLSKIITKEDLKKCEIDFIYFTAQCEELYGKSSMNFNTHALLHVVNHVYKSGPLPLTSAFPYENGIFVLKQKLSGPKGALIQLSKRLVQKTMLETELLNTSDNNSSRFCKSILRNHFFLEGNSLEVNSSVTLLANDNNINQNITQVLKNAIVDIRLEDVKAFNKAIYKNVLYTTTCYKREKKTDDRFFEDETGDIIEIFKIVLYNTKPYILGYKYNVKCLSIGNVIIDSIFEVTSKSSSLNLFTFQNIKKQIVYINIENGYFCRMPNTYETQ